MIVLRSPLPRVELNEADVLAGAERLEAKLFHEHRVVIVRLDDPRGLARLILMSLEAWAIGRFGKRAA